ncbi:hypothetical protein [Muribaculum intestinale]|uniref:hypothetical protein n=1 Tax=Muribaculum intestinale TaxID=1796646 RepID=UPI0025A9B791|nr:hypothetical protein [Muribaculum intestinale]
MSDRTIAYIALCGGIGLFAILFAIFVDGGWIMGVIGLAFWLISLSIFLVGSKGKKDWGDFGFPMGGGAILSLLLFLFLKGCVFTEPEPRHYPYHNAKTGKGQYEYGGSREQKRDLERIDDYLEKHPNE